MTREHKTILAIAAGLTIFLSLPIVAVLFVLYVRRTNEAVPPPNPVDVIAKADWVEVIPKTYWVIGPFGPGHGEAYEPEQEPDPAKPCKTPDGKELTWAVKPIIPGANCLDFRKSFKQKKTDDTAAYALVYVHSPRDQAGELLLGSDDTIAVWLNGAKVHENNRLRTGVPDDDQADVEWKQHVNTLLIRVGNATGDHLFFAKLRSPFQLRASTSKDPE